MVTGIERKAGLTVVYNLTVEDDHSYFVGQAEGGTWVHNGPKDCVFNIKNVQHEFDGHAGDFGITGNNNGPNRALFMQAIQDHINSASVQLPGTYRGTRAVTHFFEPSTGLWTAVDANNQFVAGWRLGTPQIQYLFSNGNVQ